MDLQAQGLVFTLEFHFVAVFLVTFLRTDNFERWFCTIHFSQPGFYELMKISGRGSVRSKAPQVLCGALADRILHRIS